MTSKQIDLKDYLVLRSKANLYDFENGYFHSEICETVEIDALDYFKLLFKASLYDLKHDGPSEQVLSFVMGLEAFHQKEVNDGE